jgi:Fe-S-cluster containining protein
MNHWTNIFLAKGKEQSAENKKYLEWLKRKNPKQLDVSVQKIHHSVFNKRDCLQCANCCKTTSPIFYPKDIERAAKHLRMKAVDFEKNYLRVDEDGDFVLQSSPCTFLMEDNACSIYEHRPAACRDYPHTDRKNFVQITALTFKNTLICPAAVEIVDELKKLYNAD